MKRFLGTLTVGLLLSLVMITVVGGVAFGTIVGLRLQAEKMSESSGSISLQSDPDGTGPAGPNLRWASGAGVSARASQSDVRVPTGTTVNQIQLFTRQGSANTAVFAIYVDGTAAANRVGTFRPSAGPTWRTVTVNLTTAIGPGVHTIYIGPNATFSNNAFIDWFELHNTGSTGGDTTPPAAPTITGGPAGGGTDSDGIVSFSFTGAESGGTFECSNVPQGQAANYSACTSPKPYSGLANGSYTFSVRQKDAAGNVGAATTRNYSVSISTCTDSLQAKIDAALTGSTVSVRGDCIYRQQVSISKALTLVGQSGAEIRGSNVFSGWSAAGGNWVSSSTVPTLGTNPSGASCQPNTSECTRPQQVFINGTPQTQVAVGVDPAAGQFALDSARRVVLGSDPSGKQVEVTVRQRWVRVNAGGVTIDNIDMRHAGNGAGYQAALLDDRGSNFTIKNSQLSYAHGAVLGMSGGSNMRAENNDIHHGGQLGIHSYGGTTILTNNKIHDNNFADYNSGWEAAGLKATFQSGSQWTNNEVYNNAGTGLWCDLKCDSVTIANNRIHHNEKSAIFYEISSRGTIRDNVVWENGWRYAGGAWAGAIRAVNCDGCEIARNTLAWNYSGISVVATPRTEQPLTRNNWVHDNRIYFKDYPSSVANNSCNRPLALAYCQSYASTIYSSNNRGNTNRYYFPTAEGTIARYHWGGIGYTRLSDFNGALGEEGASYLSTAEKDSALSSLGVPTSPSR